MSDRVFFPLVALIALALITLSLVWPQGSGAPSPAPFGRPLPPAHQDPPGRRSASGTQPTSADQG